MKRVLLLLALLSCRSWAVISAPTCQNGSANTVTAIANSVPLAVTAGDGIVVNSGELSDSTSTFTLSDGVNTYSAAAAGYSPSDGGGTTQRWMRATAATTTSLTITATWSATVNANILVCDVPGMANSEDTSLNTGGVGFISTLVSGPFTTTNANDIIFNSISMSAGVTTPVPDTGYTIPANGTAGSRQTIEYKIVAATQSAVTAALSWTSTARASGSVFALKAAASGYTHPGSVVTRGGSSAGSNVNDPACPATAVGSNVNGACP